jgi:hypothetical protein
MVIMGAHYLPFSHLYGMRIFLALGAGMWGAGLVIGLWFADLAVLGAWVTGLALIAVGTVADHEYRAEFG